MIDQSKVTWESSEEETQLRACLHTHLGLTVADLEAEARVASRAYVYSWRNHTWSNDFGPFQTNDSNTVNWVHLQALQHVFATTLYEIDESHPIPMTLLDTQLTIPEGTSLDEKDWAGVKGDWLVSFCFCDHRVLLTYNESAASPKDPLDTSIIASPGFGEIFRTLPVTLHVKGVVSDPLHPSRPKIYFVGVMNDPSTSTMSGSVYMTKDDQVRWHFVSGDQGNAVWSSEGVQVGGIGSTFGVLGSWTTIFHDSDDPVGPFWLRRDNL